MKRSPGEQGRERTCCAMAVIAVAGTLLKMGFRKRMGRKISTRSSSLSAFVSPRNRGYDPEAVARTVVDAYDDAMEACLNDASSCYPSFAADAPTCSLDVGSDMPWPQISCTEDCVQDLFFAMDNGAYATCEDPVAAAMFLTPDLFKSCLGGGSQCSTCIDGCLADADADALAVSCATSGATTKTKARSN